MGNNGLIYIYKGKEIKAWLEETIPEGWKKTTLEDWKEINQISEEEKEMNKIISWFNETDYIELQAIRGTISREDPKYVNYLSKYNSRLERYQELKNEL